MKLQSSEFPLTRRLFLGHWMAAASLFAQQKPPGTSDSPDEWVCPMDPDVHASKAGKCPRCGMTLVLQVPDRVEYPLEVTSAPDALHPSETATLILRVLDPTTNQAVRRFEIVHEKLMHLFLVSENLEYFLHDHPVPQEDGSFRLNVKLPYGGMYRLLADFYPTGSVPQLAVNTLFVAGQGDAAKHLRLQFVESREEGLLLVEKSRVSALLVLPRHLTDNLLEGKTNAVELYENPAEQILPRVVRQGV